MSKDELRLYKVVETTDMSAEQLQEKQRYKEAMEFAVRYLSGSELYDIQSVVNALQEALKGDSEEKYVLQERVIELEKENQRYKELLERIKKSYPVGNDEFVPVEVIYEIQMIIDKALKGETNETSK